MVAQVAQVEFMKTETLMTQVQEVMFQELAQRFYQEEAAKAFQMQDELLMFVARVKAVQMGLM